MNYIPPLARRGGGRGKSRSRPSFSPVLASVHTQVNYHTIPPTLHIRLPPDSWNLPLASRPLSPQDTSRDLFTTQYSLPSKVDFPGCILTLPTRFRQCPFEPMLPSCAISAHDPREPLVLWAHSLQPCCSRLAHDTRVPHGLRTY